jgi:2-keto-4-pentenoate hydratase/2-oxohepta-3-ene-1,7-dioic acid hydratase in catechol pathway
MKGWIPAFAGMTQLSKNKDIKMTIDKIVCVGKNYLDHALELGDLVPEKPVLFLKPASVLKQATHWGEQLLLDYPSDESHVQPECEIVLCMGCDGYRMTQDEAKKAISAVTLGLDMTLRSTQSQLKKQGHPWTIAKVFKDAAVLGPWIPYELFPNYLEVSFELRVEDQISQSAKGSDMMMLPEELLVYISHFFPLQKGDIIFTGTPAGVSDVILGNIARLRWDQKQYSVKW